MAQAAGSISANHQAAPEQACGKKRRLGEELHSAQHVPAPSSAPATGKKLFWDFTVRTWTEGDKDIDPRALWSRRVSEGAEMIRKNPTLPPRATSDLLSEKRDLAWQSIDLLPATHCAFVGCDWTGDSEDSLCQHLQEAHEAHLQPCMQAAACQIWWRRDLDWHKKIRAKS